MALQPPFLAQKYTSWSYAPRCIDVYETEGTGKNRTQRIMIHYKFVGVIEIPDSGDNYTADTRKGVAVEYVTKSA